MLKLLQYSRLQQFQIALFRQVVITRFFTNPILQLVQPFILICKLLGHDVVVSFYISIFFSDLHIILIVRYNNSTDAISDQRF